MKRLIIALLFCSVAVAVSAQEERKTLVGYDTLTCVMPIAPATAMPDYKMSSEPKPFNKHDFGNAEASDSLHLPLLDARGRVHTAVYPLGWGGWYGWNLHDGLNLNIGASVFASFGKGAWHGAGFGQNIAAMYALPVTDKLSVAVGGYLSNVYWAHNSYRDAGLNAVVGYRFDEHWEAYMYGQKSLVNRRMPLPLYDINALGDRIGAAVRYNFSPSVSVQVSVEREKR